MKKSKGHHRVTLKTNAHRPLKLGASLRTHTSCPSHRPGSLAAQGWSPPKPFSVLLPAFTQNVSTKKPPRNKTRSRGCRAGVGTRRPERSSRLPTPRGGSQGAAGLGGASVPTFAEVFQNLPPTPPLFSPPDVEAGPARGGRARTVRQS